jgi:urease accessory protein
MITFNLIAAPEENLEASLKIQLPYDLRKKSRFKATAACGSEVGMILPRGHILRHGTLLKNESGDVAIVLAADEQVSTAHTSDPVQLAKAAYHLGNRHVPLQVGEGWVRYQHDHVLDDMVKGLGLRVTTEQAAFEPEDGAYSHGGHHHHH